MGKVCSEDCEKSGPDSNPGNIELIRYVVSYKSCLIIIHRLLFVKTKVHFVLW